MQVAAFRECLFNQYGKTWMDFPHGFAAGIKGSFDTTDCASTTDTMVTDFLDLVDSLENFMSNIIQPYYDLSTLMISIGNNNVACSANAQATQLNIRTQTSSGAGDLAYTLFYFPIEGFFQGSQSSLVQNQIWNAVFSLEQGFVGRRSQSCRALGYEVGRIYQAIISFEIPDEILFASVNS